MEKPEEIKAGHMSVMQHTAMEYRRRVCLAMNHISSHLGSDLPLEEVAGVASFSMFHFHRIFKAVVGETVSEFTRRLRLEWAANCLLSHPRDDITHIAIDCGFSSSQNFARAFRQHFGMSPSAYRKRKNGNKISKGENVLSLQTLYNADTFQDAAKSEWRSGMNAEVREMPEYHVAYVRRMGPYGKTTQHAVGELLQWAGPRGYLTSGPVSVVYWDNPEVTPPGKCRVDACIPVPAGMTPGGQVGLQLIGGGPCAVCHFAIGVDRFQQAWEDAYMWLVSSGYESADRPCYELYHNNGAEHPEGKWIFDICIPLKSK